MADKNKPDSAAARAGRFLAKLLGRRTVEKLSLSARALRDEYHAGREEAREDEDPAPVKPVPHRVVESVEPPPEPRGDAEETSD